MAVRSSHGRSPLRRLSSLIGIIVTLALVAGMAPTSVRRRHRTTGARHSGA